MMKNFKYKKYKSEWKKFKLWCEKENYNRKIPGEYGFMNTTNGQIALLIDFGKIRLIKKGIVDAEFEMIEEKKEILLEEDNGKSNTPYN